MLLASAMFIASCQATTASSGKPGSTSPSSESPTGAAHALGSLVLKDIDGRSRALSDYLGNRVCVVSFWATYCGPCRKKTEDLQPIYEKYADSGLAIIAISIDEPETQGQVRPFIKQRGISYPAFIDTECKAIDLLNPRRTLPFTVIIDREGRVAWSHVGWVPGDERLLENVVRSELGLKNTEVGHDDR